MRFHPNMREKGSAEAFSAMFLSRCSRWVTPRFPSAVELSTIVFIASACLAGICLLVFGINVKAVRRTLEVTARFSYLWFWFAYAGSAIAFFVPWFQPVARHGREFGLAFVSSHSIHLLLVIWLYQISPEAPIALNGAIFFSVGVGFMYLLALLSIKRFSQMIGPRLWQLTFLIGMEYIEYAFLTDFWVNPLHPMNVKQLVAYLPFMLLGLLGTTMRVLRWAVKAATPVANA